MHSLQGRAAVTAAKCPWAPSLSGYHNNPLKMTVLVRNVISRAMKLCPWKVVGLRLQVCFSLFPSLSRTMNQSEQTQPLSQLGNWGTKRSDSLHSYLPVRNPSMGQEPCKKTQFSISKVSSFLQALKPGATPVAGKVLLSPQPHPEPLPAQQLCNHPEQGKRRVAWFGGCSQPVELAKPCSLLAPGTQDKPCSQQGLHRDGLATSRDLISSCCPCTFVEVSRSFDIRH